MYKKRSAFTLVELLVVVAIIAILLTLIMPAMRSAREQAKGASCISNQKQIAIAYQYYASDYDGRQMDFDYAEKYWFRQIAPYLGDYTFKRLAGSITDTAHLMEGVMKIGVCPATTVEGGGGNVSRTWSWSNFDGKTIYGSYAANIWVLHDDGDPSITYPTWYENWAGNKSLAASRIKNYYSAKNYMDLKPEVPIAADGKWVDCWPMNDVDVAPLDLYDGNWDGGEVNNMRRICMDRHNMAVNVAFQGGRVERTPLRSLWLLEWHKYSIPNPNPIDPIPVLP